MAPALDRVCELAGWGAAGSVPLASPGVSSTRFNRAVLACLIVVAAGGCSDDYGGVRVTAADPAAPVTAADPAAPVTVAGPTRVDLAVVDLRNTPDGDENYPVVEVEANDNTFGVNAAIRVRPGTEVMWTNVGRNDHNVIPLEPSKQFGVGQQAFTPGRRARVHVRRTRHRTSTSATSTVRRTREWSAR